MANKTEINKIYEKFRELSQTSFNKVTTSQLNMFYNIMCRAKRDEEFCRALRDYTDNNGIKIDILKQIESFFFNYNNFHGVDITKSLIEYEDANIGGGLYFIGKTYIEDENGNYIEKSAIGFKQNEKIIFIISLYSYRTGEKIKCPKMMWRCECDDGTVNEGCEENTDTVIIKTSSSRPGAVRVIVNACDENGKIILGAESFNGGAIVDIKNIRQAAKIPEDFVEFWKKQIARLYKVKPTDTKVDKYAGNVVYEFNITDKNYYHIKKLAKSDIAILREKGISRGSESLADNFNIYEVYLKCIGPNPVTGYITIPKKKKDKAYPAVIIFDGYGAHALDFVCETGRICFHVSHHGYEMGKTDAEYYNKLNSGILRNYGRCNGGLNSDYNDKEDCYILYLFLRNLQAIRFISDSRLNSDIENLSSCWNGEFIIRGGSMGGYQAIAAAALSTMIPDGEPEINVVSAVANIPGFCNLGGHVIDKRINNTFNIGYCSNMDYFDCTSFANYVKCDVEIPRCGLGDYVCPPSGIIATYNAIKGNKRIKFYQNSTHGYIPDKDVQIVYEMHDDQVN